MARRRTYTYEPGEHTDLVARSFADAREIAAEVRAGQSERFVCPANTTPAARVLAAPRGVKSLGYPLVVRVRCRHRLH